MHPSGRRQLSAQRRGDPGPGVIFRGRIEFDAEARIRGARPDLDPVALGPHADRLAYTARHARRLGDLVHITLYRWIEDRLWTQEVHFVPRNGGVDALLAPPLKCLGVPNDQPLLEMAMAHSNDVILVTEAQPLDEPGPRVVYANPAFTRMTGYSVEEIIGATPRILQGPGSERDAIERMGRALRAWQPVRVEVTNYRKDGTPFVVELDLRPVTDAIGWHTHWVAVQRDVTARRLAEARELRLERLETIATLAGGVAHDFNNLLVGLQGNLELARELAPADTELAELISDAEAAALRSRELTRQLMTFSNDAEPSGSTRTCFDLRELVRETARFVTRGTATEVVWDDLGEDGDPVSVEADPSQIGQVVSNVVLNAIEAMGHRGSVVIGTRVAARAELPPELDAGRAYAVVDIEDTGPGLTDDELHRIFEPYYSTKDRGSGIGLAVCWAIMRWHDGVITASRGSGAGLRVRLLLPGSGRRPDAVAPNRGEREMDDVLRGLRVLWMDDDSLVRSVAARLSDRLGWELWPATRGEEALDVFLRRRSELDLIILDLTVRNGLGGADTLRALRVNGYDGPVLIASGYSAEARELEPALEDSRVARLTKPFRLAELQEALRALLRS
jgi:PAS domain S-box-containing protein